MEIKQQTEDSPPPKKAFIIPSSCDGFSEIFKLDDFTFTFKNENLYQVQTIKSERSYLVSDMIMPTQFTVVTPYSLSFLVIRLIPFGRKFRVDEFNLPQKLEESVEKEISRFCEESSSGYRVKTDTVVSFINEKLLKLTQNGGEKNKKSNGSSTLSEDITVDVEAAH